jgi:predicted amidohydrolase YtcJ
LLAASSLPAAGYTAAMATLIIENAQIWTDAGEHFAECAVVDDGCFTFVGAAAEAPVLSNAKRLDVGGRVVLPGLIDSHIHMLGGGMGLSTLCLADARSRRDFVERLRAYAATLGPDEWVIGWGWSTESWNEPEDPTKEWLDEACGGRPACLKRMDFHSAVVNSAALKLAGISAAGPDDPESGQIDRGPDGEPTGMLREHAMRLVQNHLPKPTPAEQVEALRRAEAQALQHGITAVADIPFLKEMPAYEKLAATGPGLRYFVYPVTQDWRKGAEQLAAWRGQTGRVRLAGLKTFMDGSLGSRTAYMHEPFLDEAGKPTDNRGLLSDGIAEGALQEKLRAAQQAGLQPMIHAIGDAANTFLLDAYEEVFGEASREARPRIEHAQHLAYEDLPRFGLLGAIASMQPYHKAGEALYAEAVVGRDRCETTYAFRALHESGAMLAFGSDWPVVTLNVFVGIDTAVTGRGLDGEIWQPQQSVTIDQALRGYTSGGAYAVGAETEIGRIAPGYRADFCILDRSPWDAEATIAETQVLATYLDGERAYAADGWS